MKGPCPNYFVRRNADNPPERRYEVVRDNLDGSAARPVAQFTTKTEALERCRAIRARTRARRSFLSGSKES